MSRIQVAEEELRNHWRSLQQQWQATCELWQDSVQATFEREFWEEWQRMIPTALEMMRELDAALEVARSALRQAGHRHRDDTRITNG